MIKSDEWLTNTLEFPTYRFDVENDAAEARLHWETVHRQDLKTFDKRAFYYAKIPSSRWELLVPIMKEGFSLLGASMRFRLPHDAPLHWRKRDISAGFFKYHSDWIYDQDREAIEKIAATRFKYDRFHEDPEISDQLADTVKLRWVQNYLNEAREGGQLFWAKEKAEVIGFLAALTQDRDTTIDLIATTGARKGTASTLIAEVRRQHPGRNLFASTQLSNIPACRMYSGLGFHIESAAYVLHWHAYPKPTDPNIQVLFAQAVPKTEKGTTNKL
jgi:ribosomal protein S18 acetylase RimI-like enzyme